MLGLSLDCEHNDFEKVLIYPLGLNMNANTEVYEWAIRNSRDASKWHEFSLTDIRSVWSVYGFRFTRRSRIKIFHWIE
jgi:hypothetical protein